MTKKDAAVVGVIFSEERDKVLLIKRRDIPVWVLPGGGIDPNESAEDAIIREMHEETGYHVRIKRKYAEYLPVNWLTRLTHAFECTIKEGNASIGSETLDVKFFPLSELPKMPPPYSIWIEDAHSNQTNLIREKIRGVTHWKLFKLLLQYPHLVSRFLLTKIGIHCNCRD